MDPIAVRVATRSLQLPGVELAADLALPPAARGLVIFAHGSGSSRRSSRNRFVAEILQQAGLATLLFDLLSPGEEERDRRDASLRFDIPFLSGRLEGTIDWALAQGELQGLPLGLFGASTGAAAALHAAAARPGAVRALVSRGGRPDLAAQALPQVRCPTLLIVGSLDADVLQLNRAAAMRLAAPHALQLVPGASHLFEEPGTLAEAARLARDWFVQRLR